MSSHIAIPFEKPESLEEAFWRPSLREASRFVPFPLILVSIAGPSHEDRRALETEDFPVLDSRTSCLHGCGRDVSIYCMVVEALLEESLFQALS